MLYTSIKYEKRLWYVTKPDNYCDFLFRGHQIFRLKIFNAIIRCPYLITFTGALIKFNLFTWDYLKQTIYKRIRYRHIAHGKPKSP